jgi:hypothetical protein
MQQRSRWPIGRTSSSFTATLRMPCARRGVRRARSCSAWRTAPRSGPSGLASPERSWPRPRARASGNARLAPLESMPAPALPSMRPVTCCSEQSVAWSCACSSRATSSSRPMRACASELGGAGPAAVAQARVLLARACLAEAGRPRVMERRTSGVIHAVQLVRDSPCEPRCLPCSSCRSGAPGCQRTRTVVALHGANASGDEEPRPCVPVLADWDDRPLHRRAWCPRFLANRYGRA